MAAPRKAAAKKSAAAAPAAAGPESGPLGQVFGIRHLSPAGAYHLKRFIEKVEPTAILIEGPGDADEMLPHLANKKTKPPVALLAFTKQRPVRSILYPLAEYSPEWVAATMGLKAKALVRFMDLPAAVFLGLQARDDAEREAREKSEAKSEATPDDAPTLASQDTQAYLDDPYEAIAQLSGDPDHDTWWEKHFEHSTQDDAYRYAIHEFGRGLREIRKDDPRRERETLLREAYMRRVIRQTISEGHDPARIVVVCGAFHSTALVGELPAMSDAELAALPALPTTLTLMPYSYYRLSAQSGYGAGNHAPGYFQALWEELGEGRLSRLPTRFLAELAGALRKSGNVRSSAEVIEAVRLAEALAAMHGDACNPTLRDLRDAATTCLAGGDFNVIARHLAELEVGASLGATPPGVARTSLQDDFYRLVKDLKLEEYLKDLGKDTHGKVKRARVKGNAGDYLDLRENRFVKSADAALRDRNRSVFLHRLEVLGIGFAEDVTTPEDREQNTFKEAWEASWTPECEINLVENALRGDTIEIATVRAFQEKLAGLDDVGEAAKLARQAIRCNLPDAVEASKRTVQALAVDGASFAQMATAAWEIAQAAREKDITAIDVEPLKPVLAQVFLRAVLLAPAAARCDDEAARKVGAGLIHLFNVTRIQDWADTLLPTERWYTVLDHVAEDDQDNPFVAGTACALLLDEGRVPDEVLDRRVARRISPGSDPGSAAGFFEGLASRNHMALLSRKKLWSALTEFVEGLDDAAFTRAVVGLRRAFGAWEMGEVRRIGSILAEVWGAGGREIAQALETKLDDKDAAALQEQLGDLGDLDF